MSWSSAVTHGKRVTELGCVLQARGWVDSITFLDYFYLPMGDPADTGLAEHQAAGVEGWILASRGRTVALVGPDFAQDFSFLNYSAFVKVFLPPDAELYTYSGCVDRSSRGEI